MNASLKLVYSEAQNEEKRLAQLKTLNEKDLADEVKIKALRERYSALGREITDLLWNKMYRDVKRRRLQRGGILLDDEMV